MKNGTKAQRGFTLVELLIVVAIIGILAAIAFPNYKQYVTRSRRAAAESEMLSLANREEQYLIANRAYADKDTIENSGYNLPSEVSEFYSYAIDVGTDDVPSYTITFTPSGDQASDGDLTIDSTGEKTPADKW